MQGGWLEATEIVVIERYLVLFPLGLKLYQINNPQTDQNRIKMGLKTDHTNQILGLHIKNHHRMQQNSFSF